MRRYEYHITRPACGRPGVVYGFAVDAGDEGQARAKAMSGDWLGNWDEPGEGEPDSYREKWAGWANVRLVFLCDPHRAVRLVGGGYEMG